jgi:recombination protein RecT
MADGAIQNTLLVKQNTLKHLLAASKDAIAQRLPRHLDADRMIKVALTAINKNVKLLSCTRESITLSVMQAAELGLEPGGSLGEGYLVPYNCKVKDEKGQERWEMQCQFIPGYRGLIVLARRSGEISNIYAEAVYECDKFDVELGLNPKLVHIPDYDSDERDDEKKITFTYAVAKFKDGSYQFVVLSRKQIEKLRSRSKAATSGPWVTDFEQMAIKTAIRRLSKHLPLSVELAKALDIQGKAESGDFTFLDGNSELQLGDDSPDPEVLMDKLGMSESDKANVRKGYKDNPHGLLDYLLKKTAPLTQTVKPAATVEGTVQASASTTQASEAEPSQEQAKPDTQQETQAKKRGRPSKEEVAAREAAAKAETQPEQQEEKPAQEAQPAQDGSAKSGSFEF